MGKRKWHNKKKYSLLDMFMIYFLIESISKFIIWLIK